MKKFFVLICLIFISFVHMINASEFTRILIRINVSDVNEQRLMDFLDLGLDIISYRANENKLDIILHTTDELNRIKKFGITARVILEDIDSYSKSLRQQSYLDNFHNYD